MHAVCMFDKFLLDVQPQIQSVTWRSQNTKKSVDWHLHTFVKNVTSLNVACLVVVRVISIPKVSIDMLFSFFTSQPHYMSISKSCVSIDMHFFLCASFRVSMAKTCKNSIKMHNACMQCVCLTNFHLTFNFKSKVSPNVFKTQIVNWHLHFPSEMSPPLISHA